MAALTRAASFESMGNAASDQRRSSVINRAIVPGTGSAAGAGGTQSSSVVKAVGEVEFSSQYTSPQLRHSIS
jgi:hypothetical protein